MKATLLLDISIGGIIGIVIAVALVIGIIAWAISIRNKCHTLKIKIEEAESDIDVALTKRYDLLTKQLDIVKGYAKHEKETLVAVTEMRANMSPKEKSDANATMDSAAKQINILAEQYPDLKANTNFKELQIVTADVEEHLQASRRVFNANVNKYNAYIVVFPNNIVANMLKCKPYEFFEAEETKKQDVKMEF